ncbi:WD40 repeat domain-containing protein, partial [Streptomyces sp. NPDC088736]|uniref:WD40 repeat domain-containing protein n=1 Tax=Streptomyces sp. NPDC088736 TaxID=3365881 RepID=UPI0037F86D4F
TGPVIAVAVVQGPDGPLAITTSIDGTAIVWDIVSGARRHTLTGHTDAVIAVAVVQGPDGPLAITTSIDGTAIVWDLHEGERYRCHLPAFGRCVVMLEAGFVVGYQSEVAYFEWPRCAPGLKA